MYGNFSVTALAAGAELTDLTSWKSPEKGKTEKLARQAIVFIFFQYLGGQNTGFLLLNMIQETLKILLQLDLFQFSPP